MVLALTVGILILLLALYYLVGRVQEYLAEREWEEHKSPVLEYWIFMLERAKGFKKPWRSKGA